MLQTATDRPHMTAPHLPVAGVAMCLLAVSTGLGGCSGAPEIQPDTSYLVTLDQLDSIGYQIGWESAVAVSRGGDADQIQAWDDYVLTVDSKANILTALNTRDGRGLWDEAIGTQLENLRGVTRRNDELLVSTQSDLYFLDIATGRTRNHQKYDPANSVGTPLMLYGPFAIYGTFDGRIVYHHLATGLMKSAYRFDSRVNQPIVRTAENEGAVFTDTGRIYLMDLADNSRIWTAAVRDPILARPLADNRAMYVSGTDQSVWAFRLDDGKFQWRFRCQQPLTDDPTLIDDTLYQSEKGRGLIAIDTSDGSARWVCSEVSGGTVIVHTPGNELIVWDADDAPNATGGTFYRVDQRTGRLNGSFHAAKIHTAIADRLENGTIYGLSRSGRLIKLLPGR